MGQPERTDPTKVRSDLVILARESRGMTQGKLADALGISQGHLSKIEAGLLPVSESLLHRLVGALGYPEQFFTLSDPIYGPGASEFYHRKRASTSARLLARVHAQVNIRRIQVARLLRGIELDPIRIPQHDPDEFPGGAVDIARAVRAEWALPRGPIASVTGTIEAAGGIVIPSDLGSSTLDALGRYVPGMPPLFYTNQEAPPDRTRMTLAHELGHTVMHRTPNPEMEEQAFRFAGEFLMPARDISHELDRLNLDRLIGLKLRWGVSMQALIMRAEHLGHITKRQARYLWMQMGKAGFRTREPIEADIAPEEPTLLASILDVYRNDYGYSTEDLAHWLALEEEELIATYGLEPKRAEAKPRLRLLPSAG